MTISQSSVLRSITCGTGKVLFQEYITDYSLMVNCHPNSFMVDNHEVYNMWPVNLIKYLTRFNGFVCHHIQCRLLTVITRILIM